MQRFAFTFLCGLAGLFLAVLILVIGFWKVLFILGLAAGGAALGALLDRRMPFGELRDRLFDHRREDEE